MRDAASTTDRLYAHRLHDLLMVLQQIASAVPELTKRAAPDLRCALARYGSDTHAQAEQVGALLRDAALFPIRSWHGLGPLIDEALQALEAETDPHRSHVVLVGVARQLACEKMATLTALCAYASGFGKLEALTVLVQMLHAERVTEQTFAHWPLHLDHADEDAVAHAGAILAA